MSFLVVYRLKKKQSRDTVMKVMLLQYIISYMFW